mgnify:CR=1 FL=1
MDLEHHKEALQHWSEDDDDEEEQGNQNHHSPTQPNNNINYQTNSGFDFDQQIISSASNISDKENDSTNNTNFILSSTPRNLEQEPTKNKNSKLPSLEERLDDYYDSLNQSFEKDQEKSEKLDKMKSIERLRKRVERKEKRTVKDLSKFFERAIL